MRMVEQLLGQMRDGNLNKNTGSPEGGQKTLWGLWGEDSSGGSYQLDEGERMNMTPRFQLR